jgi:D-galactarolactone cycloisomerase
MYNHTRDFGRKGSIIAAISGIDTALWDLLGKAYAAPVSQLIGGRFRSVVQPYATGFYRLNGQNEGDRLAEEAVAHIDAGFKAMKIKLGFGVNDDIKVMRQIGRAIEGRDVELMVDTNHAYGRTEALRLGRVLDEYDLRWYEEPVPAEDVGGYIELRQKLKTPIAGGENEHSIYGFRELLNCHAVDIVQPDIGSCGGVTGARHVIALAQANGIEVNPHVWGSGVAQAASLQVLASLPNAIHSLYSRQPILEYDRSSHPFRNDLVDRPLSLNTNGMVEISESPGLGVEVNRAIINKYKIN